MMGSFSVWHWLTVAVVLLLVFGLRRSQVVATVPSGDGLAASWALAIPRGDRDTYSCAERLRDEIAKRFRQAALASVSLTTYESVRGSGAVWLRLEVVKPDADLPELSLRTVIAVAIDRFDFHRFEHVVRLDVGRGSYRRSVVGLTELKESDIVALMAFAAGERASFPRLRSVRLRDVAWQFWRPRNHIKRLRRDWLSTAASTAGWALLLIGGASLFMQTEREGEACEAFSYCADYSTGGLALFAGLAVLVVRHVLLRRRRTLVLNTGKPSADPLSLVRMDSWQATLSGLGERQQAVQDAILHSVTQRKPPGVAIRSEWIGYASVDGKVEREQHVVSFRRAIAFVRLESYGQDLYVGWDSHVNAGVWREQDIGQGIDRVTGRPVVARHVVNGWQQPSEYDISDASFLTEWLHACVVGVVKQQIAEYRIDQDIDFTIQRESRADALRTTQPAAEKSSRLGAGLFRRTA